MPKTNKFKKMKSLLLTVFIAILFNSNLTMAQGRIDSLKIIPSVITPSSNIQVISKSWLPSSGCPLISSSISVTSNTIDVYATHNLGIMLAFCPSTQTITVGTLQPGGYCLLYHLIGQTPNNTYYYDIDTICFTVEQSTGLQAFHSINTSFKVFPNPTTSLFTVNRLADSNKHFDVEVFNLYGQKLYSIKQIDSKTSIDIGNFSDGTYILVITSGDKVERSKIIKSTP